MITMILILLSATIAKPKTQSPIWTTLYEIKWYLTGFFLNFSFSYVKNVVCKRRDKDMGGFHLGIYETDISTSLCRGIGSWIFFWADQDMRH